MDLEVHVYHHWVGGRIEEKLDELLDLARNVQQEETHMAGELDALQAQVQSNSDVQQSAIALLQQLADMLRASANDPAKILAIADQLKQQDEALAAAVVANTPAAPAPPTP